MVRMVRPLQAPPQLGAPLVGLQRPPDPQLYCTLPTAALVWGTGAPILREKSPPLKFCTRPPTLVIRHCRQLYAKSNMLCQRFHFCTAAVKNKLFTTFFNNTHMCALWVKCSDYFSPICSFLQQLLAYNA